MEEIYVIGHKNPDTDSVVSAICMAALLNARDKASRYKPARCGNLNSETEFVFKKLHAPVPKLIENASGRQVYLVDHNEPTQTVDGNPEVIGIVDHHKINFKCPDPIEITTRPWGSTVTVIFDIFQKEDIAIPDNLKPLMLSALLSDTVILKSPTTTPQDTKLVKQLASETGIDYEDYGMEMFKAKSRLESRTAEQIIGNDYKEFKFGDRTVGIGQIETVDFSELEQKIPNIVENMEEMKQQNGYYAVILMLTDIIKEGTKLVIVSDEADEIAGMFDSKLKKSVTGFLPGVMSRKKQIIPVLDRGLA